MGKQIKSDVHIANQHGQKISNAMESAKDSCQVNMDNTTNLSAHNDAKAVIVETELLAQELLNVISLYTERMQNSAIELSKVDQNIAISLKKNNFNDGGGING